MLSMTDNAIKEAFSNLRDSKELKPLQDAARCRSESDWLIGINGTRAVTIKRTASRGRQVSTVGLYKPLPSLVIDREWRYEISSLEHFTRLKRNFPFEMVITLVISKRKTSKSDADKHDRIDRMWDQDEANTILADLNNHETANVSETNKRSPQSSGKLYDLTTAKRS